MEEFDFYPQKPELVESQSKGSMGRTVFSIFLFVITFLMIGMEDIGLIVMLLTVLIIHESGHFLAMKIFKYTDVRMLFIPLLGAFVQGKKEEYQQRQSLIVVLAGPIPGIILGCFSMYYGAKFEVDFLKMLSLWFLGLNMLNLLPLDPLDGGQILKLMINRSQELFQLIFSFISSLIMILGGWYYELWVIVIFGFLMGLRVRAIQKNYQIHKELDEENVNFKTTYAHLSNKDFSTIKRVVIDYTPALRTYMEQVSTETIDPIVADQVTNVLVSPLSRNTSIFFRTTVVLIWISAFVFPVYLAHSLGLLKF